MSPCCGPLSKTPDCSNSHSQPHTSLSKGPYRGHRGFNAVPPVRCWILQSPTESVFSMRKYIMWLTSVVYQLCKSRPLFQRQSLFQSQKPQALLGDGGRLGGSCPSQPLNLLIKKRCYLDCLSCLWWESHSCLLTLQPFPVTTFY